MIRKIGLRKLLVLLCCGLIVLTVSAAERYAGEFLLAVESPRARAMGGIGALLPGGGFAVARNPAWLADIPSVDVSLLHTDRFAGIVRNDFVGVASPGKNGGVGFALYRTGVENIPYTRLINRVNRFMRYKELTKDTSIIKNDYINYKLGWENEKAIIYLLLKRGINCCYNCEGGITNVYFKGEQLH